MPDPVVVYVNGKKVYTGKYDIVGPARLNGPNGSLGSFPGGELRIETDEIKNADDNLYEHNPAEVYFNEEEVVLSKDDPDYVAIEEEATPELQVSQEDADPTANTPESNADEVETTETSPLESIKEIIEDNE